MTLEKEIKESFSSWFTVEDWVRFKAVAEIYYQRAVFLLKDDINYHISSSSNPDKDTKLLVRNIQKRLDIGIATELLIKSYYLKNNFMINQIKDKKNNMKNFPFLQSKNRDLFLIDNTFTMNDLISNLSKTKKIVNIKIIDEGFRIAKVFRNKEGHVVTNRHDYNKVDYDRIERALESFYCEAFSERLEIQFSFEKNEEAIWNIEKLE